MYLYKTVRYLENQQLSYLIQYISYRSVDNGIKLFNCIRQNLENCQLILNCIIHLDLIKYLNQVLDVQVIDYKITITLSELPTVQLPPDTRFDFDFNLVIMYMSHNFY